MKEKLTKRWEDHLFSNWFTLDHNHITVNGVQSIKEYICVLEGLVTEPSVFRGESKTYVHSLTPPLVRGSKTFTPYRNGSNITQEEVEAIERFRNSKLGKIFQESQSDLIENSIHWLPLASHYSSSESRYPTRLLNVTRNALIALYFACRSNFSENGWVYIFNENSLLPQKDYEEDLERFEIAHPLEKEYTSIFENYKMKGNHRVISVEINPKMITLFQPKKFVNYRILYKRILEQSGEFIWWHPIEPFNDRCYYFVVKVNAEGKKEILNNLSIYFNINEDKIFPPDEDIREEKRRAGVTVA